MTVRWYEDTLSKALLTFPVIFTKGLGAELGDKAEDVEQWAQENAPWEDRTGDARDGLTAEAGRSGLGFFIELYHTVDYGIWLEIRWDGKYAIIVPAIEHFGPEVMGSLSMRGILAHGL